MCFCHFVLCSRLDMRGWRPRFTGALDSVRASSELVTATRRYAQAEAADGPDLSRYGTSLASVWDPTATSLHVVLHSIRIFQLAELMQPVPSSFKRLLPWLRNQLRRSSGRMIFNWRVCNTRLEHIRSSARQKACSTPCTPPSSEAKLGRPRPPAAEGLACYGRLGTHVNNHVLCVSGHVPGIAYRGRMSAPTRQVSQPKAKHFIIALSRAGGFGEGPSIPKFSCLA